MTKQKLEKLEKLATEKGVTVKQLLSTDRKKLLVNFSALAATKTPKEQK
jgi:hypothetical protein